MHRIALGIEYTGTNFNGWQSQFDPAVRSIQSELERALGVIAAHPISVRCAGRTDAGVHATGQVVDFETTVNRSERAWIYGANTNLPRDIKVLWAKEVPADFDARRTALQRHYKYIILNTQLRPSLLQEYVSWYSRPLDIDKMQRAAQNWVGEHDFSSFRASGCQSKSSVRNISSISVTRRGDLVIFDILANAFLYHMIRNMVGSLCSIGSGKMSVDWSRTLLQARDRSQASATAAPQGLYLAGVHYPLELEIPQNTSELWFLKQG